MIKRIRWDSVLLDFGGSDRVEVRSLPLGKRRRFVELQEFIGQFVQAHPDISLGWLFDHDDDFGWAVAEVLGLFGLSTDQVSAAQLNQLLFAYDGGPGALWQLEFPELGTIGKLIDPDIDPYHAAIAAVWSFNPDRTLAEITESIADMSWADVEGILGERNRITIENNPELKQKAFEKEQIEAMRESLESMNTDDFFAGLNPFE
jgi:hypothetical protein